jgi:hypothetical protein
MQTILLIFFVLSVVITIGVDDAFANDGKIILEMDILEHDTSNGTYNSLVQVDSDTYALAYAGVDNDGHISTFTISSDGTSIVEVDTLEHEENGDCASCKAHFNSLVQVDSNTYALAYAGAGSHGHISTFTILSDGTSIVEVKTLEHAGADGESGNYNSLVQVDSDTYALAYAGGGRDGYISTFTIKSDDVIIRYAPHIDDKVLVQLNSDKEFILNSKDTNITNISSQVGDTINITISA